MGIRRVRAAGSVRPLLCVLLGACAGCSMLSSKSPEAPRESLLATRCRVGASSLDPLVTEWPGSEKANLEALLQHGRAVAVQFTGCSMQLMPQCELAGQYVWQRTSPSRDVVEIDNEAELFTKLPLGALALEAELRQNGQISVQTLVSGQLRLQGFTAEQVPQTQGCLAATHVIAALSVGAYEMRSARTRSGSGSVGYTGIGQLGGGGRESTRLLGAAGDPSACNSATTEKMSENCSSPVQVFLSPIPGRAEPAPPPGSVKVGFVSSDMDMRWDVYLDDEATCTTPCDRWVNPTRQVSLRSRTMDRLKVPPLEADRGPLQVTAHPTSYGKLVTGITFTTFGGIAIITGTTLTAIGCGSDRSGCTGGVITLGAGLPVTAGAILLMLDAMPKAEVRPLFDTRPVALSIGPGVVSGTF